MGTATAAGGTAGSSWLDASPETTLRGPLPAPNLTPMSSSLVALTVGASDPAALARFWGGLLGWGPTGDPRGGVALAAG